MRFNCLDEVGHSRRYGDLLTDFIKNPRGQSFKGGDALSEAFCKVEFAPHGTFGDGGDLGFDASMGGEKLNDLVLDQGGVHIEDNQAGLLHRTTHFFLVRFRRPDRKALGGVVPG